MCRITSAEDTVSLLPFSQVSHRDLLVLTRVSFSPAEEASQPCPSEKYSLVLNCSGLTFFDYTGVSTLVEVSVRSGSGLIPYLSPLAEVFLSHLSYRVLSPFPTKDIHAFTTVILFQKTLSGF